MASEMSEYWRDINEHFRAKRAEAMPKNAQAVADGIPNGCSIAVKNGGHHIIITAESRPKLRWDFWPSSGKWHIVHSNKRGRGVSALLKRIRRSVGRR